MALDKKEIALTTVGVLSGLALTYLLWKRSQASSAAQASAAATAAANAQAQAYAQAQQESQFGAAASFVGGGGYAQTTPYSSPNTTVTSSVPSTADNGTSTLTDIINGFLSNNSGSLPTIPANALIPEVTVNGNESSVSGIATTSQQIIGNAAAGTVTNTGQSYSGTPGTQTVNTNITSTAPSTNTNPIVTIHGKPVSVPATVVKQ
jgi:hypothetical protein